MREASLPVATTADRQIEEYASDADFGWVAAALSERRDGILERWLSAALSQPFNEGKSGHEIADHIPLLFDALLGLLNTTASSWIDAHAPLENIGILTAAQGHARDRAEKGLNPADVVVEFRLLRQEIWRALRAALPDEATTGDVVAAEMLVNDALDSAITQGLAALTDHVEQVREEFLATTIHDVRQPLTAISGEVQLLIRRLGQQPLPDPARMREGAERIAASTKRMMSILETLSDMSRVALGSLDLHIEEVNLEDIVRKALSYCPPEEVSRTAIIESREFPMPGEWDPDRLGQVMSNLLGNAFKYSDPGTPVEITLSADDVGEAVTLTVRDYGIGIPAKEIANVFALYRRGENAVQQGIEGQGLGLYLCKGIVEAHGGRIWAESEGPGQGTAMMITLPRHAAR